MASRIQKFYERDGVKVGFFNDGDGSPHVMFVSYYDNEEQNETYNCLCVRNIPVLISILEEIQKDMGKKGKK